MNFDGKYLKNKMNQVPRLLVETHLAKRRFANTMCGWYTYGFK